MINGLSGLVFRARAIRNTVCQFYPSVSPFHSSVVCQWFQSTAKQETSSFSRSRRRDFHQIAHAFLQLIARLRSATGKLLIPVNTGTDRIQTWDWVTDGGSTWAVGLYSIPPGSRWTRGRLKQRSATLVLEKPLLVQPWWDEPSPVNDDKPAQHHKQRKTSHCPVASHR